MILFLMTLMAATVAEVPAPDPRPEDEAAAIAWFKADSHPLSGADATPGELAPIAGRLAQSRVIGLGEATHGSHEDQLLKANLIKELVRHHGVTVVALEANRDAVKGFDAYIRNGTGDPVALMRSKSFFRAGRDEEFGALLIWLRAWNQVAPTPVRMIGIDNQDAARDAAFAIDFAGRHDKPLAARLRRPLAALLPRDGQDWPHAFTWIHEHTTAEIAAVKAGSEALRDAIRSHRAWRADDGYDEAAYAAEVAWQCLHEFEREGKDSTVTFTTDDYFARRDVFMAQNLLARAGAGRAVIWAHADHVMSWLPPGYVKTGYSNLGRELKSKLGADYSVMGVTYSDGAISTVAASGQARPASDAPESIVPVKNDGARDIGRLLSALPEDAAWLSLPDRPRMPALDRWVLSDYNYGWAGWWVRPEDWQRGQQPPADKAMSFDRGFDVMVWFRHITPARRLPERP